MPVELSENMSEHGEVVENMEEKSGFPCSLCDQRFTSRHGLQFHRARHQIICEKCWCRFNSRDQLAKVTH